MTKRALIIVDVQNDFCEGGALGVQGGNDVALAISEYVNSHHNEYASIIFTKDWHKADDDNGGHISENPDYVDSWPVHCIAGEEGANLHPAVANLTQYAHLIAMKGHGYPSYSAFSEPLANIFTESLDGFLQKYQLSEVDVVGLAYDYCVLQTAVDAATRGYTTRVIRNLTAAVHPDKDEDTLNVLETNGVEVV